MAFGIDDAVIVAAETAGEATVEAASTSADVASEVSANGADLSDFSKSHIGHSIGTPSETESELVNSDLQIDDSHVIDQPEEVFVDEFPTEVDSPAHHVSDDNLFVDQLPTEAQSLVHTQPDNHVIMDDLPVEPGSHKHCLPEGDLFVDQLPTEWETSAHHISDSDLFVDQLPTETESLAHTLSDDHMIADCSVESKSPIVQSPERNLPVNSEHTNGGLQEDSKMGKSFIEDINNKNISESQELDTNQTDEAKIEQEKPERDPNRFSEKNQFVTSDQVQEYRNNPENEPLIEGCEKNADILRSNMEKVMGEDAAEIDKSNSRAHHIVGDNEYSGESKAILEKFGVDINSPENGIFLPHDETSDLHGTIHNGKHTQAYNDEVTQRLKQAKSKEDVLEILDSIKEDLYNGDMELYNNHKYNE